MGWFWQSPPRSPAEGKSAPPRAASETQTPPKAQDDAAMDPEITKFLAQFQSEFNADKDTPPGAQKTQPARTAAEVKPASASGGSWLSWRSTPPSSQDPSPSSSSSSNTATRATTPPQAAAAEPRGPVAMAETIDPPPTSCRQAFDLAFHCNGLGGQWNAVYRYGQLRDCSEPWDEFWFCMRVKSYSAEQRAAAYKRRHREKELARYGAGMPSSEDVWASRDRKVEPGTEFVTPLPAALDDADLDSVEWSLKDIERRRKIREGLGFDTSGPQAGAA